MALAVYLDGVLPDANGVRRPPWFFLLPSYWGLTKVLGRAPYNTESVRCPPQHAQ